MPAAKTAKAEPAPARKAQTHSGWIIQIGAFETAGEAKQRLDAAQSKAKGVLARADAFTEPVTKGDKMLERTLHVLGNGTLLASASVPHGTSEKIEQWFRAHPLFEQRTTPEAPTMAQTSASPPSALVADELRKLAELRSEGILTDEEFAAHAP